MNFLPDEVDPTILFEWQPDQQKRKIVEHLLKVKELADHWGSVSPSGAAFAAFVREQRKEYADDLEKIIDFICQ